MQNMELIVSALGVGVGLLRLIWDVWISRSGGSGYEFIFGRSARGGALHYLKALEGDDGYFDNVPSAGALREGLARGLVEEIARSYSKKRHRIISGTFDTLVALAFSVGSAYCLIVLVEEWLKGLGETRLVQAVLFVAPGFALFEFILLIGLVVYMLRVSYLRILSRRYRKVSQAREVPISYVRELISTKKRFLFMDATLCSGYYPVMTDQCSAVRSLLTVAYAEGDACKLRRTELGQVKEKGYKECVIRLVSAFVQRFIEGRGEDVTVFVFSEYGVTSVEVVNALCNQGFVAYDLGHVSDRERIFMRSITQMTLLWECDLMQVK